MPDLVNHFVRAARDAPRTRTHPRASTPERLVEAAAEALNAAGAGLNLLAALRIPLAATSEEVRHAEQLETTLGDGPGLGAVATARPAVADTSTLHQRWPLYLGALLERTPFRSVVSLPLVGPGHVEPVAALDLYYTAPAPEPALAQDRVQHEIATVTMALLLDDAGVALRPGPATTIPEPTETRLTVWTAVGMVMAASDDDERDSLARLRAHAFSHDLTLDALAQQLTTRHVAVDEVFTSR